MPRGNPIKYYIKHENKVNAKSLTPTSVCIWAVLSNISPNISSLIVPPITSSSTGAVWLVIGVCEHRSVHQHHQEVSLLSGWQIPTRGQTAVWKRWRTMSSSSLYCKIHTHQLLIYMIFVVLMKCLFPLQSSESCKTMQVSVIYLSIRFEIWTTVRQQPYIMMMI